MDFKFRHPETVEEKIVVIDEKRIRLQMEDFELVAVESLPFTCNLRAPI